MPDCKSSAPEEIDQAAGILRTGGAVVYPTETLYGLGVDALSPRGVERLLRLKVREAGKPTSILVRDHHLVLQIIHLNGGQKS